MGISFGSTGIKPYVGSKEVQEAYVGSTLVYSAGPGSNYAFIGTADGYYLADWCTYENCSIEQDKGIYKIKATYSFNKPGKITLNISGQKNYTILKFTGKHSGGGAATGGLIISVDGDKGTNVVLTNTEEEYSVAVNANAQSIVIRNSSVGFFALLNNIYLE